MNIPVQPPGRAPLSSPKPKAPPSGLSIGEHIVPWSFVWKVHGLCRKDWDDTIDAFWKARNATGKNGIQKYILCGFRPGADGKKYMHTRCKERRDGKMDNLRSWWNGLYIRKRGAESTEQVTELVSFLVGKFS